MLVGDHLLQLVLASADSLDLIHFVEKVRIIRDLLLFGIQLQRRILNTLRVRVSLHIVKLLILDPAHQLPILNLSWYLESVLYVSLFYHLLVDFAFLLVKL